MINKEKMLIEFYKVLEEHEKYFQESKKLNIRSYFCGNKEELINDFLEAYRDNDLRLINKITGAMICDIKSYKLIKNRGGK